MKQQTSLQGLYVITDQQLTHHSQLLNKVEQAILGGCGIVQYRDKSSDQKKRLQQAQELKKLCQQHQALLIINDDIELAHNAKADGVHLGKDDNSIYQARAHLGADSIIGVSCYNDLALAIDAQQQGADYVAFGSFFASAIKPHAPRADIELLKCARQQLNIPVAAIGGIDLDNASDLIAAGADMLAVISAVFATEDSNNAAREFSRLFK